VTTAEGALHADEVVIAAGTDSGLILESIGLKLQLEQPAGLLIHTKPAAELLKGLVLAPGIHVRQTVEGRLVAGSDIAGADLESKAQEVAADLHAKLQSFVSGAEDLELERFTLGLRPSPPDGIPAFGRTRLRQGLYLAVMHSGMTLAPVIGNLACREILADERDGKKYERYYPDRLLK
jgi:glycine/D-amino acid oxidase-like deaminating enzyme